MSTENSTSSAAGGGLGFVGALTIAFIVLRLCHVIDWSVWWVISPIWITVALVIAIFIIVLVAVMIRDTIKSMKHEREFRKEIERRNQR